MSVNFQNLKLKIGNENVERIGSDCQTNSFKFVGLHLDEFLTWDQQINHVHGKLASSNYAISTAKNVLPLNMKINLYNSMFRSHLEYGILAWGGVSGNKTKGIFNLQKKCIRNVAGKKRSSHTDPLFSQLKILKFSDLFKMNCLNFMHNFAFGRQPQSFNNMFTPLGVQNRTGNYQITKYKSNFFDKFPSAFLPKIWNENCRNIKH